MSQTPVQFNVQNNHPLIPRQNYYTLDKKLVAIHSEDRDYCQWPNANHFEVTLPATDAQRAIDAPSRIRHAVTV